MQVRLEVAHEKANVRTVTLRSGLIIGRGAECKLRIASNEVSRRHCRISLTDTEVLVRDLGSSNGTFVDGERLDPEVDVPLSPGSQLVIGGVEFVVRYDAPESAVSAMDPGSTVDFREASREESPGEAVEEAAAEYVEVEESGEEAAEVGSDAEDTQQMEYPPDEAESVEVESDEATADETAEETAEEESEAPVAATDLTEPEAVAEEVAEVEEAEVAEEAPLFEAADEPEVDEPEVDEVEVAEEVGGTLDVAEDAVGDEEAPPAAEVVDPESEVPPQVSLEDGFAAAEDRQPGDTDLPMTEEFGGLIDPDAVPAADEVVPVAEGVPVDPADEVDGEALLDPDSASSTASKGKKKRSLFGFLGRKRKSTPAAREEPPAAEPVVESDAETVMDGEREDRGDAADVADTVADAVSEDEVMDPTDNEVADNEVAEEAVAEPEPAEEEAEFGDEDVAGFLADLNDSEAEESAEEDSALGDFLKRFNE